MKSEHADFILTLIWSVNERYRQVAEKVRSAAEGGSELFTVERHCILDVFKSHYSILLLLPPNACFVDVFRGFT